MNPFACIWKLFTADLTPEERAATWKLMGSRGWHLGLLVFVAFSLGGFAPVGVQGFVRAGQLQTIQADMKVVKDKLIDTRKQELPRLILDATDRWCSSSGDARRLRLEAVNALRSEYMSLMAREFERVNCEDLK